MRLYADTAKRVEGEHKTGCYSTIRMAQQTGEFQHHLLILFAALPICPTGVENQLMKEYSLDVLLRSALRPQLNLRRSRFSYQHLHRQLQNSFEQCPHQSESKDKHERQDQTASAFRSFGAVVRRRPGLWCWRILSSCSCSQRRQCHHGKRRHHGNHRQQPHRTNRSARDLQHRQEQVHGHCPDHSIKQPRRSHERRRPSHRALEW